MQGILFIYDIKDWGEDLKPYYPLLQESSHTPYLAELECFPVSDAPLWECILSSEFRCPRAIKAVFHFKDRSSMAALRLKPYFSEKYALFFPSFSAQSLALFSILKFGPLWSELPITIFYIVIIKL